jgi:hypothetical protein
VRIRRKTLFQRLQAALESVNVRIGPLGELIDETEYGEIERPLMGRDRLDVPAHELAEHALHRNKEIASNPSSAGRPMLEWTLRGYRPSTLCS